MAMQPISVSIPIPAQLTKIAGDVDYFKTEAEKLVVSTETLGVATDLLGLIKSTLRDLDEQRKFIVGPLNTHVKNINARVKEISDPIEAVDQIVRRKVTDFHAAERIRVEKERARQEQEELDRLAAEAERIDSETPSDQPVETIVAPVPMPAVVSGPPRTVRANYATSSMKDVWKWEVANEADIPREYLVIDEVKVNAVVRAGIRNIPGFKIFKTQQLAVR